MMIEIPTKLQNEHIKFVLLGKGDKKPYQEQWQNKLIRFDDDELKQHIFQERNYGVMGGGQKNLVIIDFDNLELQNKIVPKLPQTFTVKTGTGKLHKYFFCDRCQSFKIFDEDMNTLADIQGEGKQVVGANSYHPNGNRYEVVDDSDISYIDYAEIKALLNPFDKKPKKDIKEAEKTRMEIQDDFLDKIKSSCDITDVLNSFGVDTSRNPTACPFHASKGGKCLGFKREFCHCFHCIHPDQDIITLSGIKKASEIKVGDITINALGEPTKITSINKHKTNDKFMLSIYVNGINFPLRVTENHGMYYYKNIKLKCNKIRGKSYKCKSPNDFIGKVPAKEITNKDALFIPSLSYFEDKNFIILPKEKESVYGPKRKNIDVLPLSNEVLWMLGMYIAEGNSYRGGIKFSLNRNEEDYANKIVSIFSNLEIKSSKFYQETPNGKSLLVHISNTSISYSFKKLFGNRCDNKKVPVELINLPKSKLKNLFKGILDGDGSKRELLIKQTSKQLMSNLIIIGRKLGYFCSSSIDKIQENRKPTYTNYFSLIGYGKLDINNNQLNPIKEIICSEYDGEVIDITVEGHHSILTPQGIIGNCDGSWNIFSLVKDLKKCDFREALEYLANMVGLSDELEISKRKYLDRLKENVRDEKKELKMKFLEMVKEKKENEASEMLADYIIKNSHIYTIKNDEKVEVWIYRKGVYVPHGVSEIKIILRDILDIWYNQYIVGKVMQKIEVDTYIDSEKFFLQTNIEEVPLKNGILNIYTRELKPFSPEKIFFNKLNVEYNPHKDCPRVEQFLKDILRDEEDRLVFYELGGFCLLKEYKYEKSFMFLGDGRNGKDKSLELFKRLLGVENCCAVPLTSIVPDSFIMSEFFCKMVNLAGEIGNRDLKDSSAFKGLTGRSLISAQRKFMNPIVFKNYAKFVFACNELPMVYDDSKGFWDRWVLLEYPFTFVTKDEKEKDINKDNPKIKIRDESIIEKISTDDELSGLLNKFLEGLDRLELNKGFSHTKGSDEVKQLWIRKSNSFMAFCMDFISDDYDGIIVKKELRKRYVDYCNKHKLRVKTDFVMKRTLQEMFGASEDKKYDADVFGNNQVMVWSGIKWKI